MVIATNILIINISLCLFISWITNYGIYTTTVFTCETIKDLPTRNYFDTITKLIILKLRIVTRMIRTDKKRSFQCICKWIVKLCNEYVIVSLRYLSSMIYKIIYLNVRFIKYAWLWNTFHVIYAYSKYLIQYAV